MVPSARMVFVITITAFVDVIYGQKMNSHAIKTEFPYNKEVDDDDEQIAICYSLVSNLGDNFRKHVHGDQLHVSLPMFSDHR